MCIWRRVSLSIACELNRFKQKKMFRLLTIWDLLCVSRHFFFPPPPITQ